MLPAATPHNGGFTFAEHPEREAPEARIIWHASLDPGTLSVVAVAADRGDPDALTVADLAPWLTVMHGDNGMEHAVLSDGWHHIRIDIVEGSLAAGAPVVLHYRLSGIATAEDKILPLRRFLHLCRHHRFASSLFPRDSQAERQLLMLRVHDGLAAGASQREIAVALYGPDQVGRGWEGSSDAIRSRIRRLVAEARAMAKGGYRRLLLRD